MNFSKRPLLLLLLLRKYRRLGPISLLVASLMASSASSASGTTVSHAHQPKIVANPFLAGPSQVEPQQTILLTSTIHSSQAWDGPVEGPSLKTGRAMLLRLPSIDRSSVLPTLPTGESAAVPAVPSEAVPLVSLLPPQLPDISMPDISTDALANTPTEVELFGIEVDTMPPPPSAATTGALTASKINELAQRKIRHGYALAERGAYYAARRELVEVLRLISRSHDAREGTPQRTKALAEGLRALEEVEDFVPRGTQLEAEMDLDVVCASHRTLLADLFENLRSTRLLPQQMTNLYFRHAQLKLSESVAGEPAGSMALHALGKLYSRLEKTEPKKHRLAHRHAVAFQQAALLAHADNHLAAHELGVLLAQSGHFIEAEKLLSHVAQRELHPMVLRNLARVQQEMGHTERAVATREHALRLTQAPGANHNSTVEWISPAAFSQTGVPRAQQAVDTHPQPVPPSHLVPQQPRPTWQTPMTANVGLRVAGKPVFFGNPPRTNLPVSAPTSFGPAQAPPSQQQWR